MSVEREVKVDGVTLKGQQLECYNKFLDAYEKGEKLHWCVLGLSGTGKTTLLKAIQKAVCTELGEQICLATAHISTAAAIIGARTIHSTFLLDRDGEVDNSNQPAIDRMNRQLCAVDVLLIDNISHADARSFVSIDRRLREAFRKEKLFGGTSVILFGDLYQQEQNLKPTIYRDEDSRVLWRKFKMFELTQNHKYATDEWNILRAIALEGPTDETTQYLMEHCQMNPENDVANDVEDREATQVANQLRQLRADGGDFAVIAPTNDMVGDVQRILNTNIEQREFPRVPVREYLNFPENPDFRPSDNTDIPVIVFTGCSVILTVNINNILHGTKGVVVRWDDDTIVVRFEGRGDVEFTRVGWYYRNEGWYQFPLLVIEDAYNYTMSEGLSFDGVIIVRKIKWNGVAKPLYAGQFYSGLSRARSLKKCRIFPMNRLNWYVPAGANEEMERLRAGRLNNP